MGQISLVSSMLDVLHQEGPVDCDTQHRIARWARLTDDARLLEALLLREDLDAELDAELFEIKDARTRAAWLARPGRPAAVIAEAVARDTREAVLATLGAAPAMAAAVYETVVERCKGVKPLFAVLSCDDAPETVKQAAIAKISVYSGAIAGSAASTLSTLLKDNPAYRGIVLRVGGRVDLLSATLSQADDNELDPPLLERLLRLLVLDRLPAVETELAEDSELGYGARRVLEQAASVAVRLIGADPAMESHRVPLHARLEPFLHKGWQGMAATAPSPSFVSALTELAGNLHIGGVLLPEWRQRLLGDDPVVTAEAAATLASVNRSSSREFQAATGLLREALRLDVLDDPTVCMVLRHIPLLRQAVMSRASLSIEVAVGVAQTSHNSSALYEALELAEDSRAAIRAYLGHPLTKPSQVLSFFADHTLDDSSLLACLPVGIFGSTPVRRKDEDLTRVAGQYVMDHLGNEMGRWQLFIELGADFTGTIGQLLMLVDASFDLAAEAA